MINKFKKSIHNNLASLIVFGAVILCVIFLMSGRQSENGSITLNGKDAQIQEYTEKFIETSNDALYRIMNENAPTNEETIKENENEEARGQGFYTTISDILSRRLADGNDDNGNGWQCSRYTAWLATGKWTYSTLHPDYGPVNGKDVASWLVKNYGFKYIEKPVEGAIGSGGFNTLYGHTVMYLYSLGGSNAMVNDANYTPLTVATHPMDISGWVWVVPGDYNPTPEPEPATTPEQTPVANCNEIEIVKGDTMGKIMLECEGRVVWGAEMLEYAKTWYSTRVNPGQSVYDGWISTKGVGLYAGDLIKRRGAE